MAALMLVSFAVVHAHTFEVDGHMENTLRVLTENRVITNRLNFRVSVDEPNWFIHVEKSPSDGWYCEAGYDGRDVYQVLCSGAPEVFGFTESGSVSHNDQPSADGLKAQCIWLAYASSRSLAQAQGQKRLQPVWLLDDSTLRLAHFKVPAEWKLISSEPRLPEEVRYFDDGFLHYKDRAGLSRTEARPKPYSTGFLRLCYRVLAVTNFEGLSLPTESVYEQFTPDPRGEKPEDVLLTSSTRIHGENFRRLLSATSFRPALPGVAQIDDERFWDADVPIERVRYRTTNGFWLAQDNPSLRSFYLAEKARWAAARPQAARPRWPVYALFATATLLALGLLLRVRRREGVG